MYGFLALFVGALASVQSRANGQLSVDVHSALGSAVISNAVGWVILWIIVLGRESEREGFRLFLRAIRNRDMHWWELMGGAAGAFFLAVQSSAVPEIGVAIFTICLVGGQTVTSLLVDKFGFSTSGKQPITRPRVFAAIMTLVAVSIAVYPDLGTANFKVVTIVLCLAVGVVIAFQYAINSRINVITKNPMITTWLNFSVGISFLAVALIFDLMRGGSIGPLPHNFWVYIGGPCGLLFVAVAASAVRTMGVLNFILISVTGQLVGALLLDWLLPTSAGALNGYLIAGTVVTLASIAFSRFFHANRQKNLSQKTT
ncbi:MAG: DMT family transporter [Candidatus Nanopelagicaceae bacterium]